MSDEPFVLNSPPVTDAGGMVHYAVRAVSAFREARDQMSDTWPHAQFAYCALVAVGLVLLTGVHRRVSGIRLPCYRSAGTAAQKKVR